LFLGDCTGCHVKAYLRSCLKCEKVLCERCMSEHMGAHDPIMRVSSPPERPPMPIFGLSPQEEDVSLNGKAGPLSIISLALSLLLCVGVWYAVARADASSAVATGTATEIAAIRQGNADRDRRLESIERKLDALLELNLALSTDRARKLR